VRTTENLVFTPRQHLSNLPVPPHDLDHLITHCLQISAAPSYTADTIYALEKPKATRETWLGWGVRGLDELLEWDGVGVVEIAGSKRVGKSVGVLLSPASDRLFSFGQGGSALHAGLFVSYLSPDSLSSTPPRLRDRAKVVSRTTTDISSWRCMRY